MPRFVTRALIELLAAAIGLLVAVWLLPGFSISFRSFVIVVVIFTVARFALEPLIARLSSHEFWDAGDAPVGNGLASVRLAAGFFAYLERDHRRWWERPAAEPFQAIFAAEDLIAPVQVIQVPGHGLLHAGLKGFRRLPAQFPLQFGGIDGIALIVTGPIGDKIDQIGIGTLAGT